MTDADTQAGTTDEPQTDGAATVRTASFRGIAFQVDGELEAQLGRRTQVHEYVGRDEPYGEDLGRRARSWRITAFVVGADAQTQAEKLVDACETAGAGTLVHPWIGERQVVCTECRERHSSRRQRRVDFEMAFAETFEPQYPAAEADRTTKVDEAAMSADEENLRQLDQEFKTEWMPDYVAEDGVDTLSGAAGGIKGALGGLVAKGQTYARWSRGVVTTARDALTLVQSPRLAGQRLLALMDMGGVSGAAAATQHALDLPGAVTSLLKQAQSGGTPPWRSWLPLASWQPSGASAPQTTPSRKQQAQNREALTAFVRRAALVQAARAAARTEFPTYEDAAAARAELSDQIDAAQENAAPGTYRALASLRAAVAQSVSAAAPELPRLISVTPAQTLPAIAIAHATFGDDPSDALDRGEQLVGRNRVRHPMFVPGGEMLRMVARARNGVAA